METITIDTPLKVIPMPPKNVYIKELVAKITDFTHRLRWRTFYYDKYQMATTNKNMVNSMDFTSGVFKTRKTPLQNNLETF